MSQQNEQPEPNETDATETAQDHQTLQAELEVLQEENRRLRDSYARAKRSTFRRTAVGFLLVGLISLGGAALFPTLQTIFLAFAGTGIFAGIVTYYLTPERFISASVSESVFETLADIETQLATELELQTESVYVPTPSLPGTSARLFVPQHTEYGVPDADQLETLFVISNVAGEQGVSLVPTGDRLFAEFTQAVTGDFGEGPKPMARKLTAALSDQFELVDTTTFELTADDRTVSISVENPAFGDIHQRDHPVVSLVAVGFASGLNRPVTVETHDDDRFDGVITVSWRPEDDERADGSADTGPNVGIGDRGA